MTIQVITQETTSHDLFAAQIIYKDADILIIAIPSEFLPAEENSEFWADDPVLVSISEESVFQSKSWSFTHEIGNISIIKYYSSDEESLKATVKVND